MPVQADGALIELLDTLVGWLYDWAGWILVAVLATAAILSARFAHRSARAADQSVHESRRSADAAEASAESAREALQHAQATEARRGRSEVTSLATEIKTIYASAKVLAEKLPIARRTAAGFDGISENARHLIEEAKKVPSELEAIVASVSKLRTGPDALRDLSSDEVEDLAATLRSIRGELQRKADWLTRELHDAENNAEAARLRHQKRVDPF